MSLPKRKILMEIYTNGTIIIEGIATKKGLINIPKVIGEFIKIREMYEREQKIQAVCQVMNESEIREGRINCRLLIDKDSYYLIPRKEEEKETILGTNVTCVIQGVSEQYYSNYFRTLEKVRNETQLDPIATLTPIIWGGEKNTKFTIYENTEGQLFIHSKISKNGSKIFLSDELTRYIEKWHKDQVEHFVCSVNEDLTMVLKAESRPGNRPERIFKELFFYSHDIPEESTIVFTSKHFKLTAKAKHDLALVYELQEKKFQIKQLTTNWLDGNHKDKKFSNNVWSILEQAFAMEEAKILHEPKLICDSSPELTKCVDGLLAWENLVGLIEIKTSEKVKNTILDEVIGELLYLQSQISKTNSFSLLFINNEVKTSELRNEITKLYGLTNNIILIGKREVESLLKEPTQLLKRIISFREKQKKIIGQNQLIHPTSLELTTKDDIEIEAFELLKILSTSAKKASEIIKQYCFLMNIPKADFFVLYDDIANEQDKERKDPSQQIRPTKRFLNQQVLEILHIELKTNSNYAILLEKSRDEINKPDYEILFENWSTIVKVLPTMTRIVQLGKLQPPTGLFFELFIRNQLENEGTQVISNVLLSQYGKHFEIDHIVFTDKRVEIISCKDRSNFNYTPNLYSKIVFAFGWLFLRRKTLKNVQGKLFIRVKPTILQKLHKRFGTFHSQENSLIIVS